MIPSNPIPEVPNYGSSAIYKDLPSAEQIRAGVIPLDSLPAAWWNALWACTNTAVNDARSAVGTLINEVCNAITGAGICINESCIDQLYQAIDTIRQRIGNTVTAGAVKSSTCCGEVSISAQGIMTANGVGNAAQLNTTSKVVVNAINELKSTYDCCLSDLDGCICSVNNSKAPTSHVSSDTTYGVGNASCYGHLKVSDEYTCCVGSAADGVAASQLAVYCVYEAIQSAASLGNTAPLEDGDVACAGVATTAARSDHVHPIGNAYCLYRTCYMSGPDWSTDCSCYTYISCGSQTMVYLKGAYDCFTRTADNYTWLNCQDLPVCVDCAACADKASCSKMTRMIYTDSNDVDYRYLCIRRCSGTCATAWCVQVNAGCYPLLVGKYAPGNTTCCGYNNGGSGDITLRYVSPGSCIVRGWLGYDCCSACGGCNQTFTEAKAIKAFFCCCGGNIGGNRETMNGWFVIPVTSALVPYRP